MTQWYRVSAVGTTPPADDPLFVSAAHQGQGRIDNPSRYLALYLSRQPAGAVGEVFGDMAIWSESMFRIPSAPDARRRLVKVEIADALRLLDLDDALTLDRLGLRPSDVAKRNRDRTKEIALRVFLEGGYDGIKWWSYWRPEWEVCALWGSPEAAEPFRGRVRVITHEPLNLDHPAVQTAAATLPRSLSR